MIFVVEPSDTGGRSVPDMAGLFPALRVVGARRARSGPRGGPSSRRPLSDRGPQPIPRTWVHHNGVSIAATSRWPADSLPNVVIIDPVRVRPLERSADL